MALRERGAAVLHIEAPRPQIVDSLGGLPPLREALQPAYMRDVIVPLTRPEILWKLDHSVRVAMAAGEMHAYLKSPRGVRLASVRAGLAHDALGVATTENNGRIITADEKIHILNKPGLLTPDEWAVNQLHPVDAAMYLNGHYELLAAQLSLHQHTFQEDRSYPFETKPETFADKALLRDLALFAAIDTADALFTPRPYPKWEVIGGVRVLQSDSSKEGWKPTKVLEELRKKFGKIVGEEELAKVVAIAQKHAGTTSESYTLAA